MIPGNGSAPVCQLRLGKRLSSPLGRLHAMIRRCGTSIGGYQNKQCGTERRVYLAGCVVNSNCYRRIYTFYCISNSTAKGLSSSSKCSSRPTEQPEERKRSPNKFPTGRKKKARRKKGKRQRCRGLRNNVRSARFALPSPTEYAFPFLHRVGL